MLHTQVLIIGGGVTGTGLARDLSLRGVRCILAEKKDINAGASGANHGLLHSGARYVFTDPGAAEECRKEGSLLKKLAPHCIEDTGGLFVAVEGDDENYIADFPNLCARCGIPAHPLDVKDARELEPELSEKLIAAYSVADASIDPFKLSLENILQAQYLGAKYLHHTKVVAFKRSKNRIQRVRMLNTQTGKEITVKADQVINATGAWAGGIAALAGDSIPMVYSKGSLLVTHSRMTQRVMNRLRRPLDGDILVPGGTVSLLGTTSVRIDDPDQARPTVEETDFILDEIAAMIPALETTRYIRAYAGVRPLVSLESVADDRAVSRGYVLLDHTETGLENLVTITGGKLTTYRLMAEKAANLVCQRLGVSAPCRTRTEILPSYEAYNWIEPGESLKQWFRHHEPDDLLLCECEMVPRSAIDTAIASLREQNEKPRLNLLGTHTRMGKGACQGTFCGLRVLAYLYDKGELNSAKDSEDLRTFLRERWRGQHPILWDGQLIQAELAEALHCGFLCMELQKN